MTTMQQRVFDAYFADGLCQHEVAERFRMKRTAVTMRLSRARQRHLAAGLGWPPNPGTGLRTVTATSLYSEN